RPLHTLFPYTTLFRSVAETFAGPLGERNRIRCGGAPPARAVTLPDMRLSAASLAGLFLLGAAGGLIGDQGHVASGTTAYLAPARDRKSTRLNSSHQII